jgi:hypothetical protein
VHDGPRRLLAPALALGVALLVLGPALGPGYVLAADMVFVPRQDLDLDALGLGGTLPRAVPVDAGVALLTTVVPGALLQKIALVGAVWAAVLGAARLMPAGADGRRGWAAAAAGLVYGWSPWVAERLLIGHWTLLLGYAALPWVARAALRVRAGEPRALARLVLACAPAALSPTGALLAAGVVAVLVGRRRLAVAGALLGALALPWIVAGALHPSAGASDPAGVGAFAARAESWGGGLLSLLGTGGIWNALAVPDIRTTVLAPVTVLLLVALAALGWSRRGPGGLDGGVRRLLPLGVAGLLLAALAALPLGAGLLETVVRVVPGGGMLRDAQKWTAWWALVLALGAGVGVRALRERLGGRFGAPVAAVVTTAAVLLPVAATPDLAWGVAGRLSPVAYPADWQRVRDVLADDPAPGDVLVLPFGAYRAFEWNDGRPSLDPVPRWLPRPAVVDDTLVVGGRPVAGEDLRARVAGAAAGDPDRLARLGIGWVLVEHRTPGPDVPPAVGDLPVVVDGPDLTLHRVPDAVAPPSAAPVRVALVVLAHACALGTVGGAVLWIIFRASTVPLRRRPLRKRVPA